MTVLVTKKAPLQSLDMGIDTYSAVSVSTCKKDFLFIDISDKAKARKSVSIRGVGGSKTKIGGRGPMLIVCRDEDDGRKYFIVNPAGVYLEEAAGKADFRILGQTTNEGIWVRPSSKLWKGKDFLIYKESQDKIPSETKSGILTLKTMVM